MKANIIDLVVFEHVKNPDITNQNRRQCDNGTILFDMDDNLHEAEEHLMKPGWRHLLRPFGYEWKPDEETPQGLKYIQKDMEPGVGVRPLEVAKHFITTLGLSLDEINIDDLGFQRVNELVELQRQKTSMDEDEFTLEFAKILEAERIDYTCKLIDEIGVKPIPGAREMVSNFYNNGYRIGIVTSAPEEIARKVLHGLGLIEYVEEGKMTGEIDVIVHGDMPIEPKPAKDPLELADGIIWYLSLDRNQKELFKEKFQEYKLLDEKERLHLRGVFPELKKAKAHFGDSTSDAKAGEAYGIPTVLLFNSKNTTEEKLRKAGATFIVDTYEDMGPPKLESMLSRLPKKWRPGLPSPEQITFRHSGKEGM